MKSKIIIENQRVEQISFFKYLGCRISYQRELDIGEKLNSFQKMCCTIRRTSRNKSRKDTQIKFYKVKAAPLLYGSETQVLYNKDVFKIESVEIRFLRSVNDVTRLWRSNDNIRKKLRIFTIKEKMNDYRARWQEDMKRINKNKHSIIAHEYKSKRRRDVRQLRKRWSIEAKQTKRT